MAVFLQDVEGPLLVSNLASVYALTDEPDLAFDQLALSIETPGAISYGYLKLDPPWDTGSMYLTYRLAEQRQGGDPQTGQMNPRRTLMSI
jgi:hypothetical protein